MSVLAFLGGMGGGYMKQKEVNRQNEREDKRDEMYAQRFAWEKDEAERKKTELADADAIEAVQREALSYGNVNAAHATEHMGADGKIVSTPQPSAGDAEFTAYMQNAAKPEGATNYPETKIAQSYSYTGKDGVKQTFADEQLAKAHAAANPVTDVDRLNAAASRTLGMKGGLKTGLDLQAKAREAENAKLERDKRSKELQNENAFEAIRLASIGDAQGVFDAFNKSGMYNFVEPPKLTQVEREIKGVGTIKTFDIVGNVKDKDGKVTPFKGNTFDMGMAMLPYMEQVKTLAALNAQGDKSEYNANLLKIRQEGLANQIAIQQMRNDAKANSSPANGQVGWEEKRKFLSDLKDYLPKVAESIDPKEGKAIQDANLFTINEAEMLFNNNAMYGSVLTAPMALRAVEMARDPKNLSEPELDKKTGRVIQFVNVNGRQVIVKSDILQSKQAGNENEQK